MAVQAFSAARPSPWFRYPVFLLSLLLLLTGCAPLAGRPARTAPAGLEEPVREAALPLTGSDRDYDALMEMIGDSRFVLLGDATHGTHEFYRDRARITERLIREKGFAAVAIEGDWHDAFRVNQYVRGLGRDASAEAALGGFHEFPGWMWANTDVRDLVEWLRGYNASRPAAGRAGFYGLDLYGVIPSADAVTQALDRLDPAAAQGARKRYGCFSRYRSDVPGYGRDAAAHPVRSCERKAVDQLTEVRGLAARAKAGTGNAEELFSLVQNARVVRNGEAYYRLLAASSVSSWNLRDRHMAATLDELATHLGSPGRPAKIVVWAHNSHLGDASGTQRADFGELNLGQLVRQRHGQDAVLVGFTTYSGTVAAASVWGERGQLKQVRPSLPWSFTGMFHEAGIGDSLLLVRGNPELAQALAEPRPERAIGVLYHPQEERRSHYLKTRLSQQFDAVVYFDRTRAVERLGA
ncbi:MAG: erythromycin esterase family protein [Thermoanaerobaculia bacterium]